MNNDIFKCYINFDAIILVKINSREISGGV